jgi:hypothetical protein
MDKMLIDWKRSHNNSNSSRLKHTEIQNHFLMRGSEMNHHHIINFILLENLGITCVSTQLLLKQDNIHSLLQ